MQDENKNLEEKSKSGKKDSGFNGYSIYSAAYAMGYRGRVYKPCSPLPPQLERTVGNVEIFMKDIWPERK